MCVLGQEEKIAGLSTDENDPVGKRLVKGLVHTAQRMGKETSLSDEEEQDLMETWRQRLWQEKPGKCKRKFFPHYLLFLTAP